MEQTPPSIAFFMHDFSGGGVERMRLRLAAALAAKQYDVTLIVQSARGPLRDFLPTNVSLIDLNRSRNWRAVAALVAALRRVRPDILVSSLDHNNIAALCARAVVGRATRVVICQHATLSAEAINGWRYRLVPLIYRLLEPWADAIVAVSDGVAADLAATARLSRQRITVINNPVIADDDMTGVAMPPHHWLADRWIPVFLFVGRLVAQKDPVLLLEAFALRLLQGPARLIFVGEGILLQALRQRAAVLGISAQVHFAGFVVDPSSWICHATALVLSSRYEGFCNVIVEALACGTPVIATDCPCGPGEILAGGQFGRLVPVGDKTAMAAAMGVDPRAGFPAAQLRLRAQDYSVKACVSSHQALFARVLRGRREGVFGLVLSRQSAEGISARMLRQDPEGAPRLVVTPNLNHIRLLRQHPAFASACREATIVCADGFPVARYAKLRGAGHGNHVTGCAIFHTLSGNPELLHKRLLVVAEGEITAAAVTRWAAQRNPVAAWDALVAPCNLLGDVDRQLDMVRQIASFEPDILVMTLGAPVSEVFIDLHRAALPACWVLCCGQAVRAELGLAHRAPNVIRRFGAEWLWRIMLEPRRLGLRYLRDAFALPGAVLSDLRGEGCMMPASEARERSPE